jgi:putative membrane protein
MRYLNWIIRVVLFIALLGFAVKNDQPVTLSYFSVSNGSHIWW